MTKLNLVPFQKEMSIAMFLRDFGTEEKCAEALAKLRWPSGFECPSCGCAKHCRLEHRDLRQCAKCGRQTSITAGTLFEHTKLPLATWFQAIFLITQGKKGISAMDLMRKTGVSYNAAWRMKRKIMQAMIKARTRRRSRA